MNDAFERRALLLHLGRTLQLLARMLETRPMAATVGELIALNPILEDDVLLGHVSPSLSVEGFIARALQAMCCWPRELLAEDLDHDAFTLPIRDRLFDQNSRGWRAYATGLRSEVVWYGVEQAGGRRVSHRRQNRAVAPTRTSDVSGTGTAAAPARDIERDKDDMERISESVEGITPRNSAGRVRRARKRTIASRVRVRSADIENPLSSRQLHQRRLGAPLAPVPSGRRFERLERTGFVEMKKRIELRGELGFEVMTLPFGPRKIQHADRPLEQGFVERA